MGPRRIRGISFGAHKRIVYFGSKLGFPSFREFFLLIQVLAAGPGTIGLYCSYIVVMKRKWKLPSYLGFRVSGLCLLTNLGLRVGIRM